MSVQSLQRNKKTDTGPASGSASAVDAAARSIDLAGDPYRSMWIGIALLVAGLGGFLAWAAFAPLDEGVPAQGAIVVESQRKPVQHLSGGIVRRVLVREAQAVEAGDVLIELDDARLRAELETVRSRYHGALALKARLDAERRNAASLAVPDELAAAPAGSAEHDAMQLEQRLFESRRGALRDELQTIDDGIASLLAQRDGLEARRAGRLAQRELLTEQLEGSRGLAEEGYLPRNRLLEEERLAADLSSQIADLAATIQANRGSVAELRSRRAARRSDFVRQVDAELAEVSRDLPALRQQLDAVRAELDRTRLVAPVSGFVVGLQVHSAGAVLAPGASAMDIVPVDEKMVLDVRIPPQLVDRVRPGLVADIRFHAFQDAPQLVVGGRLTSVSADRLVDPATREPYFLGRIEVLPETMHHLAGRSLVPGMSAEAVIKTGERSLLDYLVGPLVRRMSSSMTEY